MVLVTAEGERPSFFAAAVKPPCSTTRAKTDSAMNLSISGEQRHEITEVRRFLQRPDGGDLRRGAVGAAAERGILVVLGLELGIGQRLGLGAARGKDGGLRLPPIRQQDGYPRRAARQLVVECRFHLGT